MPHAVVEHSIAFTVECPTLESPLQFVCYITSVPGKYAAIAGLTGTNRLPRGIAIIWAFMCKVLPEKNLHRPHWPLPAGAGIAFAEPDRQLAG